MQICLNEQVQFKDLTSGLENYYFVHRALPQIDLEDVDLSVDLLGKRLNAPVIISSMVGGIEEALCINRNLARVAQSLGLAMGVGSERCLLDTPEMARAFLIRDTAPDILLFANLGAVQLNYGYGVKECLKVVETIGADALVLHLNPLQEALQNGGNTRFRNLQEKIKAVCDKLPVPVVVKEVGGGISEEVAASLAGAGVAGLDVAGAGGTCWSEIEKMRARGNKAKGIAEVFSSWGIPTAESVILARRGAPHLPVIASGGIRTGLDAAKAIALGADAIGIAAPLLKAANGSEKELEESLEIILDVLKISMFCVGARDVQMLKHSPSLKKK